MSATTRSCSVSNVIWKHGRNFFKNFRGLSSKIQSGYLPQDDNHVQQLTPQTVEAGLKLDNAHKCPFLHEVGNKMDSETVQETMQRGGTEASKAMRKIIDDSLVSVLMKLRNEKRYREFRYFKRSVGSHPEVYRALDGPSSSLAADIPIEEQKLVNWCSNDYLNMAHNPHVLAAMQATLVEQGAGAGGTRNISGSNVLHVELEHELANLCSTESALLFNSCYTANLGVMEALGKALPKDTIVFSDQENHASLVEGIKHSRFQKKIFRHNDVGHLKELLQEAGDVPKIVVFESVYSMSGTRAPVNEILDLCEEYGAVSVLDEVHAVGLYGHSGAGVLEELGMPGRATIITGTLGKAFGVGGGFVASNLNIIDVIRSTAPSFIFTTSVSPVIAAGALASVRYVRSVAHEREKMKSIAEFLKHLMLKSKLPLMSTETHIMPLLVGDGDLCKKMADELLSKGIYVQPINFPSVPVGEELLRFTASPKHSLEHCEHLINVLVELFSKYDKLSDCLSCKHDIHTTSSCYCTQHKLRDMPIAVAQPC